MSGSGSITIPGSTPGAPEGHDAAMLARYEAGKAAAAAGTTFVPGAPVAPVVPVVAAPAVPAVPAVVPPVVPAVAAPAAAVAPPADFVDNLLATAGLTRDGLAAEFLAGGLTPASYEALAKQGVNKEAVDQHMAGLQAQGNAEVAAYENAVIAATVGTPEKYAEVVGWAATGLTPAEQDAFNAAVNSGNQAQAAFAVAGLQARFQAANPAEPALLNQGVPAGGVAAYESWAQAKTDMKSPEYKTDSAFREKVKARLAVSPALV